MEDRRILRPLCRITPPVDSMKPQEDDMRPEEMNEDDYYDFLAETSGEQYDLPEDW